MMCVQGGSKVVYNCEYAKHGVYSHIIIYSSLYDFSYEQL